MIGIRVLDIYFTGNAMFHVASYRTRVLNSRGNNKPDVQYSEVLKESLSEDLAPHIKYPPQQTTNYHGKPFSGPLITRPK